MSLATAAQAADTLIDDSLTGKDWLQAGLIVVAAIVAAVVTHRVSRRTLSRWIGTGFAALTTARLVSYLVFLLGVFYALNSLGVRVGPLLGALGLGGLVLALALQKVVENFVAGIILQTRRPFTVDDTVRIGDHLGVVSDIDSRTTVLRGLDGTIMRIPNGTVVADAIVNLTRNPTRRSSLTVGVAYDTNLTTATEAIREAAALVEHVLADPAPSVLLTSFESSSIEFTVYYWHASDVPSELAARHELIASIHHVLTAAGIVIAFPQMVVWPAPEPAAESIYPDPPMPRGIPDGDVGDLNDSSARSRARGLRRRRPT
ncbi:MAG: mechanosensitive ion channel family protein [Acidimicrobiales bacterium]|nr:mechanosensitive ion channel family protein [Acidimicrobiales bacterium]